MGDRVCAWLGVVNEGGEGLGCDGGIRPDVLVWSWGWPWLVVLVWRFGRARLEEEGEPRSWVKRESESLEKKRRLFFTFSPPKIFGTFSDEEVHLRRAGNIS
ncbi:unnamed protein product [Prunus armeniaca]|uniref:Uncharacterized protein n=1 Tax=Prunus armeniaca TaxID=36596 RepID=A0A6J5WM58_PRUAR|nr:unnamed protein product [Prunus armeniaca]